MALTAAPPAREIPSDIEVRVVADERAVVDYGRVVAVANDDPGERERAPLLFHDNHDPRAAHHRIRRVPGL